MKKFAFVLAVLLGVAFQACSADTLTLHVTGQNMGKFKGDGGPQFDISCHAFSYSVDAPLDPNTGMPTGRRREGAVTITKALGASSPLFFQALVSNETLKTVELEFRKVNPIGKLVVYYKIVLSDGAISRIVQRTAGHGDEGTVKSTLPLGTAYEEISIVFRKIEVTSFEGATTATDDRQIIKAEALHED